MTSAIDAPAIMSNVMYGTLTETAADAFLNDSAEVGAPRRRARFTRLLKRFAMELTLTKDEAAELRTFYEVTLTNGISNFNWTNPLSGAAFVVQFMAFPTFKNHDAEHYRVSINLDEV